MFYNCSAIIKVNSARNLPTCSISNPAQVNVSTYRVTKAVNTGSSGHLKQFPGVENTKPISQKNPEFNAINASNDLPQSAVPSGSALMPAARNTTEMNGKSLSGSVLSMNGINCRWRPGNEAPNSSFYEVNAIKN